MPRLTIIYSSQVVTAEISKFNTHIEGSHRFKSRRDMEQILHTFRIETFGRKEAYLLAINRIGKNTQIREWRAHNLLYALGIARKRTESVDLNDNKWYCKTAYFILSCLYWHR